MRARGIARATSRASTAVNVSGNSPGGAHTSGADVEERHANVEAQCDLGHAVEPRPCRRRQESCGASEP